MAAPHRDQSTQIIRRARVIRHRFTPDQLAIITKEFAPTIAEYMANTPHRRHDRAELLKLIPVNVVQPQTLIDPDLDFSIDAVAALGNTSHNIEVLQHLAAAERRKGVSLHWTYDTARHTQIVSAIGAETMIRMWMERAITIRSGMPQQHVTTQAAE